MPIVHDPHSGKFMAGGHTEHDTGGGGGSGGGHAENLSKAAVAASQKAISSGTREDHHAAAKAHTEAAKEHLNQSFNTEGAKADKHFELSEKHKEEAGKHNKAAQAAPSVKTEHSSDFSLHQEHLIKNSDAWEKKHYGEWQDGLHPKVTTAIQDYSTHHYQEINSALRSGQEASLGKEAKERIHLIDKAIEDAPRTPETIHVNRAIDAGVVKSLGLKPGDVMHDKAFMSTTMKSGQVMPGSAIFSIEVPKGSKGIAISDIAVHKREAEFLLPRGTRLTISEIGYDAKGRMLINAKAHTS